MEVITSSPTKKRLHSGEINFSASKAQKTDDLPTASPAKKEKLSRATQLLLDDLSIGLICGENGLNQSHSQQVIQTYHSARVPLFLALANSHSNSSPELLIQGVGLMTFTENGTGVDIEINGEKKTIPDTTIQTLKVRLALEVYRDTSFDDDELRAFAWNIFHYSQNFAIYSSNYGNATDKSLPHMSMEGRLYIRALNGKVARQEQNDTFVCRHFVPTLIEHYSKCIGTGSKVRWSPYGDKSRIPSLIASTIEDDFSKLVADAKSHELIQNKNFGSRLNTCFDQMEQQGKNFTPFLILSTTHVMGCFLIIRTTDEGKSQRVVEFYDPFYTNTPIICEPSSANALRRQTMELYTNGTVAGGADHYNVYYGGCDPISMMMEIDPAYFSIANPIQNKKCLSNFDPDSLTPTHMYFLFAWSFKDELTALQPTLKKIGERSSEELFALFSAKNGENKTFIHYIFYPGSNRELKFFLTLVEPVKHLIPDHRLIELFLAEDQNGVPGIYSILEKKNWEFVRTFGQCLGLISDESVLNNLVSQKNAAVLLQLLTKPDLEGRPLIHSIFAGGDAAVQKVVLTLIRAMKPYISDDDLVNLIAAVDANNIPGIHFALANGHTESVKLYVEFLALIPDENSRAEIIRYGKSGLTIAFEEGYNDTVSAFLSWLNVGLRNPTLRRQTASYIKNL